MQELISVMTRTIRNRMHKGFKLPARKPQKKPLITPRMAQQRLEFCCHYKDWTKEDWQKVMSSDESTFLQFASYKPFVPDHMDLHQRTHGTSNQPLSTPHRSWCWGAFPAKAEVVFIFSQKDKQ